MPSRIQVQIVLAIAVIVWAVMLFLEGVSLKASYLKPYSLAVGTVILVLLAFDRWLWRIPYIAHAFGRPVLRGTWKGKLQSTWKNEGAEDFIDPVDVFLVVHQTYSTVSLRLMTSESISQSLVASLGVQRGKVPTLSSTYQNVPQLLIQDRS